MPAKISLIGKKFGRLIVLEDAPSKDRATRSLCLCECGKQVVIRNSRLTVKRRPTKSCGCLQRETIRAFATTHGKCETREYSSWKAMFSRCTNPNNQQYKDYGARGIKICPRWDSAELFMNDMGKCPNGLSLERVNNEGDYEPGNCIWGTQKQQKRNTRRNVIFTVNGKTACLAELCEVFDKDYHVVITRIRRGWSLERAFSKQTGPFRGTKT